MKSQIISHIYFSEFSENIIYLLVIFYGDVFMLWSMPNYIHCLSHQQFWRCLSHQYLILLLYRFIQRIEDKWFIINWYNVRSEWSAMRQISFHEPYIIPFYFYKNNKKLTKKARAVNSKLNKLEYNCNPRSNF